MITAETVKQLRDKTGAGMMDCKRALTEAGGDMDKAVDILRKSGVAKAEKKVGRATNQGKVLPLISGKVATMVEMLCETDFAANTDRFSALVQGLAAAGQKLATEGDIADALNEAEKAELTENIARIGENMQLRRAIRWTTSGVFASYIHMGGKIGVLVDVEGETDPTVLSDLCMHIAAFSPSYILPADVPADILNKEKEIALAADPKLAGKPAEMIAKILDGKMNKYYTEVCLMNQAWINDDKSSLSKLKPNLKVKRFARWTVGEDI